MPWAPTGGRARREACRESRAVLHAGEAPSPRRQAQPLLASGPQARVRQAHARGVPTTPAIMAGFAACYCIIKRIYPIRREMERQSWVAFPHKSKLPTPLRCPCPAGEVARSTRPSCHDGLMAIPYRSPQAGSNSPPRHGACVDTAGAERCGEAVYVARTLR